MATKIQRKYTTSDIVMLTSASTIIENANAQKSVLIPKRATWADPFFGNLLSRIDTITQKYMGVDSAKQLRQATQAFESIQTDALEKLSAFKVQVEQDFKKTPVRKKEILNLLGFDTYYAKASRSKAQDALISLLYQFKKNMDKNLKTEIVAKGTDEASIDDITTFADTLNNANVDQETFKSNRSQITEQAIIDFNDLYDDVISVATIAAKFFAKDKAIKESFSFNKLTAAQKAATPKVKKAKPKPPVA